MRRKEEKQIRKLLDEVFKDYLYLVETADGMSEIMNDSKFRNLDLSAIKTFKIMRQTETRKNSCFSYVDMI